MRIRVEIICAVVMMLCSYSVLHANAAEAAGVAEGRGSDQGVEIVAQAPMASKAGAPCMVELKLTNRGEKTVFAYAASTSDGYSYTITDGAREVVPYTRYGASHHEKLGNRRHTRNALVAVKPGQTLVSKFNLARFVDLSEVDSYELEMRHGFRWDIFPGDPQVKLKAIVTFRVVESAS